MMLSHWKSSQFKWLILISTSSLTSDSKRRNISNSEHRVVCLYTCLHTSTHQTPNRVLWLYLNYMDQCLLIFGLAFQLQSSTKPSYKLLCFTKIFLASPCDYSNVFQFICKGKLNLTGFLSAVSITRLPTFNRQVVVYLLVAWPS